MILYKKHQKGQSFSFNPIKPKVVHGPTKMGPHKPKQKTKFVVAPTSNPNLLKAKQQVEAQPKQTIKTDDSILSKVLLDDRYNKNHIERKEFGEYTNKVPRLNEVAPHWYDLTGKSRENAIYYRDVFIPQQEEKLFKDYKKIPTSEFNMRFDRLRELWRRSDEIARMK